MSNGQDKLAALRARLQEAAPQKNSGGSYDNKFYPFFKINTDESVTLRLISDGDDSNPWFWVEKQMYDWSFADPDNPGEKIRIMIPCKNMYEDKSDPVLKTISEMFNAGGEDEERAKGLWVKKSYLFQGFVRKSPLEEENVPENPIRVFDMSKKLYQKIYKALIENDEDLRLPSHPTDETEGLNFIINKIDSGGYANYDSQSSFSQKKTPLTDDELAALKEHGPWNLTELLPKRPSEDAYAVLPEMLEAHINDEPWNTDWEEFWKPFGHKNKSDDEGDKKSPSGRKKAPMVEKLEANAGVDDEDDAPVKKESAPKKDTKDILAAIKARKSAS